MIRVRLEIVPGGDESRARQIGELHIWNVAERGEDTCDYHGWIEAEGEAGRRAVEVRRHWRPAGAWQLVMLALQDVLGGRR
jgi:hypothetical protein